MVWGVFFKVGPLVEEAPDDPSGDEAPMLASEFGVGRDRARRREVQIALQRKSQRAADGGEFEQAHVTEFRLAEPEIAKTERQIDIRVELRQEPGGVAVGGEKLYDGFDIEALRLAV